MAVPKGRQEQRLKSSASKSVQPQNPHPQPWQGRAKAGRCHRVVSKTKQLLQGLHLRIVEWFWFAAAQPVLFTLRKKPCILCAPSNARATIPCHPTALGTTFLQQRAAGLGAHSLCGVICGVQHPLPALCQGWMVCWALNLDGLRHPWWLEGS